MNQRILVTGSSGLVGSAVTLSLLNKGVDVVRLDLRAPGGEGGDVCDRVRMNDVVGNVDGIVHLAAVSRVVWGEEDPDRCWATNVGGLANVLEAAAKSSRAPWLVFASSREVYGQPDSVPVAEDAPLRPVNVYGRSKVEGERLIERARASGLRACTVRLSNVFGSTFDHPDRVVPAFARAAANGGDLRVDGREHTFDFTHINDVSRGIVALTDLLGRGGSPPPPIHFVSGRPTTLGELAELAIRLGHHGCTIRTAPPRNFDVARFFGDPSLARSVLGWQPLVSLEEGLAKLIRAFELIREAQTVPEAEL
jgi:nucleoside-diphosphate-sugar epimerase